MAIALYSSGKEDAMSILLAMFLQAAGTEVSIPIGPGEAERALQALAKVQLDVLECPGGCVASERFALDVCPRCGLRMRTGRPARMMARPAADGQGFIGVSFFEERPGLVVLYLSRVDSALAKAGVTRTQGGMVLDGPFQVHLKQEVWESGWLTTIPGVRGVRPHGTVVYFEGENVPWDVLMQVLEPYGVRDISWVLNLNQGRIGLKP
jgi:hypothetical protein